MSSYVLRRLLVAIPTVIGVTMLVFGMLHLVPGDPVEVMFQDATLSARDRELIREQLGLNDPLPVQYGRFLANAVRGDLGQALFVQRPVARILAAELPYTIRLAVLAMAFAALFGVTFGVLAAVRAGTWVDTLIMTLAIAGLSMPEFWLGLIAILVFSVQLGWVPLFGPEWQVIVLPAVIIGFRASAILSRMVRSGLLEVLNQDYIRTARSKGLAARVVVLKHGMRNALIPVVTIMGLQFGQLLGGAVIIEIVFARRGVGSLTINAILQRDLPLAQGTVLVVAIVYILVNLATDLIYAVIDPRIRYT
jgi:peptide/nickel transport system permease protein